MAEDSLTFRSGWRVRDKRWRSGVVVRPGGPGVVIVRWDGAGDEPVRAVELKRTSGLDC